MIELNLAILQLAVAIKMRDLPLQATRPGISVVCPIFHEVGVLFVDVMSC